MNVKLKEIEVADNSCTGCYFYAPDYVVSCLVKKPTTCCPEDRADGKRVIFIREEYPTITKETEDMLEKKAKKARKLAKFLLSLSEEEYKLFEELQQKD